MLARGMRELATGLRRVTCTRGQGAERAGGFNEEYTEPAMNVVISLLRGVNVGGHNQIKMEALRTMCESLGLRGARTYIQSGNVVFRAAERDLERLSKRIQGGIERRFGVCPEVIVRTVLEMRGVVARNPFAKRRDIEPSKLLVTFLAREPGREAWERVLRLKAEPEEVRVEGREIYIYYANGMARPKVPWTTIEKMLGTPGTARNWNTVRKLLELAEGLEVAM